MKWDAETLWFSVIHTFLDLPWEPALGGLKWFKLDTRNSKAKSCPPPSPQPHRTEGSQVFKSTGLGASSTWEPGGCGSKTCEDKAACRVRSKATLPAIRGVSGPRGSTVLLKADGAGAGGEAEPYLGSFTSYLCTKQRQHMTPGGNRNRIRVMLMGIVGGSC